ncbi:MAG TPA: NADH-quinone oxidoreductase subunit M [Nocardioidaceae bacterium]|nr:NADH-quinone oxidoreductase subunit M [Nocardioidaceae bacterium]
MNQDFPWLTTLMLLPIVGGVVVALLPRKDGSALPKQVALGVSVLTLAVSVAVAVGYSPNGDRYQYTELTDWIKAFGAHYSVGLDGIGLTLVLLATVLTPIVMVASWNDGDAGRYSANAFFAWMLALEGLAIGVFVATDVLLFYVLFEATLIPVYFLIGGFGGANRSYAAVKFLLYNLFGGLLMLASVVGLYAESAKSEGGATYLLSELSQLDMGTNIERWLFIGFFVSFAIKAPIFPLHTWLPDAAEQATPGTSVLMVSVLDKIGTFGMIRFCLGLFPNASEWATPVVLALATISVVYGALVAIGQRNIPRLIAYTSVSHFGFIVMGIFVFNTLGQSGSTLYMFNHGLSTAALFLIGGFLVSRRGSALIEDFGGVEKVAPILAGTFLIAGLSTLSLPGLSPFVSEFMVLAGAFQYDYWMATIAVSAIVLAALYILLMYQRTMTGPMRPEITGMADLNRREIAAVAPLVAMIIGLGLYPQPFLDAINPSVEHTLTHVGKEDPAPTVGAEEGAE